MKHVLIIAVLALAACDESGAPVGSMDRLALQYQVGEELKTDCEVNGNRCPEWLAFKSNWERDVSYMTTFEASLARWKANGY